MKGQTMTAVGGAASGKAAHNFLKNNKGPTKMFPSCRRKRSAIQDVLYDENYPKLSQHNSNLLPKSFKDLDF